MIWGLFSESLNLPAGWMKFPKVSRARNTGGRSCGHVRASRYRPWSADVSPPAIVRPQPEKLLTQSES
jgi:hypothetical protein